jgi:hypothetical protein
MATAQDVVNRAARLMTSVASGETPTAIESSDALIAFNDLLESWQADRQLVFALTDTSYAMVASTGDYTVGPTGNFALTPRPVKLEDVYVMVGVTRYPVELVEEDRWFNLANSAAQSDIPILGRYNPTLPTGTLSVWPIPNTANNLHILTWVPCSEIATLGTTLAFPPGWRRALAYNLAVELAAEYDKPLHPTVAPIAAESKATIMRANHKTMLMYTELAWLTRRRADITSGGRIV